MITHVQQKTVNSCVTACLAMVSGKEFDVIYDAFHESYMANVSGRSISSALRQFNVNYRVLNAEENMDLQHGKLYFATVPSCNGVATFHQVIIDCTGELPVVLDPAKGTEFGSRGPSRHYVWQKPVSEQYGELEFPLFSWILDYEITPKEVQP